MSNQMFLNQVAKLAPCGKQLGSIHNPIRELINQSYSDFADASTDIHPPLPTLRLPVYTFTCFHGMVQVLAMPPDNQKKDRKRRAKTGCRTCRIRHVKCGEERPACRRCVLARLVCDGYGIWGGGGSPYATSHPHSERSEPLLIYQPPSLIGSLSREEHSAFDWFMQKNTTRLSGFFSSAFWDTLVFQASAQEPAVRHAVIALSSAQKSELMHRDPASRCGTDEEHFTLQQYNKAIGHLRAQKGHQKEPASDSTRIVLITCMIFVALEYLRGRYKMGFTHLQYGISLLSENERHSHHQPSSPHMAPVSVESKGVFAHTALVDAFTRLSVQSTLYGQSWQQVYVTAEDHQTTIPHVFGSVGEARRLLDRLYARIHCLKRYCLDLLDRSSPLRNEVYEIQHQILADLSLWQTAYHKTILKLDSSHSARRDRLGFILMNQYHAMATIKASLCLEPDNEMGYDLHTREFTAIVTECHQLWYRLQLLNGSSQPNFKDAKCAGKGFTLEMGFIPPVYFTAIKCRVPRLRRQARNILCAGLHREAGWDRQMIAKVVSEVIQKEEGDFYSSNKNGMPDEPLNLDPPSQHDLSLPRIGESRRLSDVSIILPDDAGGSSILSFKQRSDDGGWVRCNMSF